MRERNVQRSLVHSAYLCQANRGTENDARLQPETSSAVHQFPRGVLLEGDKGSKAEGKDFLPFHCVIDHITTGNVKGINREVLSML